MQDLKSVKIQEDDLGSVLDAAAGLHASTAHTVIIPGRLRRY
jgi:hypothetical protein